MYFYLHIMQRQTDRDRLRDRQIEKLIRKGETDRKRQEQRRESEEEKEMRDRQADSNVVIHRQTDRVWPKIYVQYKQTLLWPVTDKQTVMCGQRQINRRSCDQR